MPKLIARRLAAGALAASSLAGCYIVPVVPAGALVVPAAPARAVPLPVASVLPVRLYPANDAATRTGVVQGAVLDLRDGRGRFEVDIDGERLAGEATRVRDDDRRGVASAFGARGTSMQCEYAMSAPRRGAGHCTLSSGARYQVHLGD